MKQAVAVFGMVCEAIWQFITWPIRIFTARAYDKKIQENNKEQEKIDEEKPPYDRGLEER